MRKAGIARSTLLAVLLLARGARLDAQFFRAPTPIYTDAETTTCLAVSDFNSDGNLDLAIGKIDGGVTLLLGDGNGSFGLPKQVSGPNSPRGLAAPDLNGDGRPDLVVAGTISGLDGDVAFYLGDGSGGFTQTDSAGFPTLPGSVAVADFDRDGKMDVAIARYGAGPNDVVTVFYGDGAGGVANTQGYPSGAGAYGILTGDFNGDPWPDLAVTLIGTHQLSVLIGDGAGGFDPPVLYAVGQFPAAVAAADLNGDGVLDLAVANYYSDSVSLFLGGAAGTFIPGGTLATAPFPNLLTVADLNDDQLPDLAVQACNGIAVYAGDGAGGFAPPVRFGAGINPLGLHAADFDHDGRVDLLTANSPSFAPNAGTVSILRSEGAGSFVAPRVYDGGLQPRSVVIADLTGDGKADLAMPGFFGVTVLRGDGAGSFTPLGTFQAGSGPVALDHGDLDQDGVPDLAVANEGSGTISILRGTGGGQFAPLVDLPVELTPQAVTIDDVDLDGRNDIVVASSSGSVSVLRSTGPGSFGPPVVYDAGDSLRAVAVGRLNNDVRPDVVAASYGSFAVSVLLGSGGGALQPAVPYGLGTFGGQPTGVAIADLNGDSRADIAVSDGGVATLLGDGSGKFILGASIHPLDGYSIGVVAADLNGDARTDVAVADVVQWNLSVFAGDGSGGLADRRLYPAGARPSGLAVGDVNADGRPDVAVVSHDDDSVWVYLGAPLSGGADLSVAVQDAPDPVVEGGPITYTVSVVNLGPNPATAVEMVNLIPHNNMTFVSSSPGPPACVFDGGSVRCQLGTLQAGETRTVTIDGVVTNTGSNTLLIPIDTASVKSHTPDPDPLNDQASQTTWANVGDLAVSLSDSADPVSPGVPFSYLTTITNLGPATVYGYFFFELPPGLVLVSAPANCDAGLFCVSGFLTPGSSVSLVFDVVAPMGFTEVTARASLYDNHDPDAGNDVATETTHGALGYGKELHHGSRFLRSFEMATTPGEERFQIAEDVASSYEVVVDGLSGDLGSVSLDRLGADATTVLQTGTPVGAGHDRSLRWENTSPDSAHEVVRVRAAGCSGGCGPEDVYRIRAYDTTLVAPRFNTTGTQTTVLVLQNAGPDDVGATVWLWDAAGELAGIRSMTLSAKTTRTLDLATVAPGISGSLTLSHNAAHGDVGGKAVSIEPATGFTFDTALAPRP